MQYDAVLFDFDGVVIETPSRRRLYDATRRTYETFGRSGPVAETAREFVRGDFESIAARCRSLEIEADVFCAQATREFVRTQLAAVEGGLRSVYDDVAVVRSLERPLGIVSDNHPTVVWRVLDRLGFGPSFDVVRGCPVTPEGLARRKPDPRNIEDAMAILDATAALYVGDRPVDVRAAHNAGVDAAIVTRGDDSANETVTDTDRHPEPDYRLTSLTQVSRILD